MAANKNRGFTTRISMIIIFYLLSQRIMIICGQQLHSQIVLYESNDVVQQKAYILLKRLTLNKSEELTALLDLILAIQKSSESNMKSELAVDNIMFRSLTFHRSATCHSRFPTPCSNLLKRISYTLILRTLKDDQRATGMKPVNFF